MWQKNAVNLLEIYLDYKMSGGLVPKNGLRIGKSSHYGLPFYTEKGGMMGIYYKHSRRILKFVFAVVIAMLATNLIAAPDKIKIRIGLSHSSSYQRPDGLFIATLLPLTTPISPGYLSKDSPMLTLMIF